jgi:Xaa-Pro aminopeptidase
LAETLKKNGSSLVGVRENLVDLVWRKERPARPSEKVRVHPEKYAGKTFQEKVAELRKELESKKKAGFVICMTTSHISQSYRVTNVFQLCLMKLLGYST